MPKHKISPHILEDLTTLASRLPRFLILNTQGEPTTLTRTIPGSTIINNWDTYKEVFCDVGLEAIQRKGKYIVKYSRVWVDHLQELKKAYSNRGTRGTADYLIWAEQQYQRYVTYLNKTEAHVL